MHNDQEAARCAILRTLVWITEGKEKWMRLTWTWWSNISLKLWKYTIAAVQSSWSYNGSPYTLQKLHKRNVTLFFYLSKYDKLQNERWNATSSLPSITNLTKYEFWMNILPLFLQNKSLTRHFLNIRLKCVQILNINMIHNIFMYFSSLRTNPWSG
jgi:hypothetical protein